MTHIIVRTTSGLSMMVLAMGRIAQPNDHQMGATVVLLFVCSFTKHALG